MFKKHKKTNIVSKNMKLNDFCGETRGFSSKNSRNPQINSKNLAQTLKDFANNSEMINDPKFCSRIKPGTTTEAMKIKLFVVALFQGSALDVERPEVRCLRVGKLTLH